MSKNPQQQKALDAQEVTRLAVSISRGAGGEYVIEDLRLAGDKVVKAEALVTKASGLRVASGEMLLNLEERLSHWQKEGVLK